MDKGVTQTVRGCWNSNGDSYYLVSAQRAGRRGGHLTEMISFNYHKSPLRKVP